MISPPLFMVDAAPDLNKWGYCHHTWFGPGDTIYKLDEQWPQAAGFEVGAIHLLTISPDYPSLPIHLGKKEGNQRRRGSA